MLIAMATTEGQASISRKRKCDGDLNSGVMADGMSTAVLKVNGMPTEHGRDIDQRLDEHHSCVFPTSYGSRTDKYKRFEFGGPTGVTAMMILFPILMCECRLDRVWGRSEADNHSDYLWICLWYYHGSFVRPESVNDIGPFIRRMGEHVYDVRGLCCDVQTAR